MHNGFLAIKLQLKEKHINNLLAEIKKLDVWHKLNKHVNEDGEEVHDGFRLMAELLFNSASPTCVCEFMHEVGNCAKMMHPDLKIQPLTPLKSLAIGSNQFYHRDYDQETISKLEPGKKFYSCIFSFSAPTHLLVKDKDGVETKMKISRGHLLF